MLCRVPLGRAPAQRRFMRKSFLFTSESVSEGHPDKVADQISDSVVDLFLSKDPYARVACETLTTTQRVVLAGEIRCKGVYENGEWAPGALEEIERTVRATVKRIGYEQDGFHWETFTLRKPPARPVLGNRAGRRCQGQQGRRRRRPGHHVRLCVGRNRRPDARHARLFAQDPASSWPPIVTTRSSISSSPTPRAR